MWCTVPRGTHTMSSFLPCTTVPPVSPNSSVPASTTHHSSNSRCQWGRFPPPGALAMRVTRLRSSTMMRFDHGAGPIFSTRSPTRVWRTLGQVELAAVGGHGAAARWLMEIENGDSVVGIDPPLDWSSPLTLPSPQRGEGYLRKEPPPHPALSPEGRGISPEGTSPS